MTDQPGWVRHAVGAFPDAHWVFVSTINVYDDETTPGGTPETLPLREPVAEDGQGRESPEAYGGRKVTCERLVREGSASSTVIRPGLIVGPEDPTGRFSYWPARLADGGEVLAPGSPDDDVQVVDVRDLATWIVDCAESRTDGVFDATSHVLTRAELPGPGGRRAGRRGPTFTWVDQDFLAEQKVEPWMGPRSIPLWLPLPEYAGLMAHDVRASYAAGLATRPIGETTRDTLAWLRDHPDAAVTGLTRDEEAEVPPGLARTGADADSPPENSAEQVDRLDHGLVDAVGERDADDGPGDGQQQDGTWFSFWSTSAAPVGTALAWPPDSGSWKRESTGLISRFATNPTASTQTIVISAGR